MTKLKVRHFTEAAKPQARVALAAAGIVLIWLLAATFVH